MLLSSIWYELLSLIYRGKTSEISQPEVTCSLIYVTTHSKPREDWCEWWTKMAASLNVFKTSKRDCILSKSIFFFAEVHWVICRIRQENKNVDDMGTFKFKAQTPNAFSLPSIKCSAAPPSSRQPLRAR